MGYRSHHRVTLIGDDLDILRSALRALPVASVGDMEPLNGWLLIWPGAYDGCKWYEHDKDLQGIADALPGRTVVLERHGESGPDDEFEGFRGDAERVFYAAGKPPRREAIPWLSNPFEHWRSGAS